ncbi:MAG: FtsW/RodA/SpoVE family cell cycle protein [Chloroflexota bacterium]|nr:FtsW/RodA/SpoVE family cell cycle protein [Chloroflexota bacterium]
MAVVGILTIFLVPRGIVAWTWSDILVSLAYVSLLVTLSLGFSALGFRGDQILLPVVATLCGLGLLSIQRLQPDLEAMNPAYAGLAQRQLLYLGLSLVLMWATIMFLRLDWLRRYKYTWLLVTLGLLLITFFFGQEINGARLWLAVGPFQGQPSELVKLTLVTFVAGYFADRGEVLDAGWKLGPLALPPIPYLLPLGLVWVGSLAVLVVQNDLGSALLFFGLFLVMLYVATGKPWYVASGLVAFAAGSWLAFRLFARIDVRIQNWLDPWQDPLVRGYQQIQSEFALASGGLIGVGLGRGAPYYIPEVQTDFVFSALAEELGLAGVLGILACYLVLVLRCFAIALRSSDTFPRLVAIGLGGSLCVQALIIVGGVVRLIPLTGLTMPFVSYGGSSLLTNCLAIGILLRISGDQALERSPARSYR